MSNEKIKINSNYLRGTLESGLKDQLTGQISADDQQVIKFHGIYQQDDRDRRTERALKKLERDYSFMIRLRIPGGKITAEQWLGVNEVAKHNSTGVIKITTRQTIQLHGVIKSKLKPTVKWFDKYGLDAIAACGDVNRNVMSTSEPAKSAGEYEVYEFSKKISEHLLPQTNAFNEIWLDGEKINKEDEHEPLYGEVYLPRKFKIVLAIPPYNDVDLFAHDIGLIAIIKDGELLGFNVSAGGGMGMTHGNEKTYPRAGTIFGYAPKDKILDVCFQIAAVQRDNGNREDRKQARLKYTIDRLGEEWFKAELEKRLGFKLEAAKEYEFKTRTDTLGWKEDYLGKLHYSIFVENGRVLGDLKTALNELAEQKLVNFTFSNNQNVSLSDIEPANKAKVADILKKYNINNEQSALRHNSMACVALNTCPLALAEGQRYLPELVTKIEELQTKHELSEQAISVRMTGCPNGCARPYLAEIGFVGKAMGKYNMYLGASPRGERLNKLYKESLSEAEILTELDQLLPKFKAERNSGEAFGDFINRINLV